MEAFERKYERDMKENAKVVMELQSKLGQLSAEKDMIKTKVDVLQDESKVCHPAHRTMSSTVQSQRRGLAACKEHARLAATAGRY